jgi:hypothetical protein
MQGARHLKVYLRALMSLMTPISAPIALISKDPSNRCDNAGPLMREKVIIEKGTSSRAQDDPPFENLDLNADCRGINLRTAVRNSSFQKRGEMKSHPIPICSSSEITQVELKGP